MFDRSSRRRFLEAGSGALAGAGLVRSAASAAQYEFKCGSSLPPDHPTTIRLTQMFAAIERESGGRIHTLVFPSSALGGDSAMLSQLRLGSVQFILTNPGNIASIVPATEITNLGLLFKDLDEGLGVMAGPLGNYVREQIEARGIHPFRDFWVSGMVQVCSSTHPIRTPDDLRGFKIRTNESRIQIDFFKGLGASATPLSFNETYTAVQTKLIDGEALPLVTVETAKHYEVLKYISMTNHQWGGIYLLANGDMWKNLPPDLRAIVDRNNATYTALEQKDVKVAELSVADKLRGHGLILNDIDRAQFTSRLGTYYTTWGSTFGPWAWDLLQRSLRRKLG